MEVNSRSRAASWLARIHSAAIFYPAPISIECPGPSKSAAILPSFGFFSYRPDEISSVGYVPVSLLGILLESGEFIVDDTGDSSVRLGPGEKPAVDEHCGGTGYPDLGPVSNISRHLIGIPA